MNFTVEENRIVLFGAEQRVLAEVTFPATGDKTVAIDHTFVDESLRGQGVAGKLLETLADTLRRTGRRATLSCSYAVRFFAAHPEQADVVIGKTDEHEKKNVHAD